MFIDPLAGFTLNRAPQTGDGRTDVAAQGYERCNGPECYQTTGHSVLNNGEAIVIFNKGTNRSSNGKQVHFIHLI